MYLTNNSPKGLGAVLVTTPGTPVKLTSTIEANPTPNGGMKPGDNFPINRLELQAFSTAVPRPAGGANAGNVYIGSKTMDKSTLLGVVKVLVPGEVWLCQMQSISNKYQIDQLYVDAANGGDGVYGNATEV